MRERLTSADIPAAFPELWEGDWTVHRSLDLREQGERAQAVLKELKRQLQDSTDPFYPHMREPRLLIDHQLDQWWYFLFAVQARDREASLAVYDGGPAGWHSPWELWRQSLELGEERHRWFLGVLASARVGALPTYWRDEVSAERLGPWSRSPRRRAYQRIIAREFAQMPCQLWEPAAAQAGPWQPHAEAWVAAVRNTFAAVLAPPPPSPPIDDDPTVTPSRQAIHAAWLDSSRRLAERAQWMWEAWSRALLGDDGTRRLVDEAAAAGFPDIRESLAGESIRVVLLDGTAADAPLSQIPDYWRAGGALPPARGGPPPSHD